MITYEWRSIIVTVKKTDRKLRHIQATNAAGIGNVFKRRLLQGQSASINPAASHATPDYRVAGSSLAEYGPRQLAALRADTQSEKGSSPPLPLRPLGSRGTDSALRLVTC